MKNSVIVRHNGILHRSFKTHMSHTDMVHMCFSRAQLSKQILERYLKPDEYQEFFANLIFLNIARKEGRKEPRVQTWTKWYVWNHNAINCLALLADKHIHTSSYYVIQRSGSRYSLRSIKKGNNRSHVCNIESINRYDVCNKEGVSRYDVYNLKNISGNAVYNIDGRNGAYDFRKQLYFLQIKNIDPQFFLNRLLKPQYDIVGNSKIEYSLKTSEHRIVFSAGNGMDTGASQRDIHVHTLNQLSKIDIMHLGDWMFGSQTLSWKTIKTLLRLIRTASENYKELNNEVLLLTEKWFLINTKTKCSMFYFESVLDTWFSQTEKKNIYSLYGALNLFHIVKKSVDIAQKMHCLKWISSLVHIKELNKQLTKEMIVSLSNEKKTKNDMLKIQSALRSNNTSVVNTIVRSLSGKGFSFIPDISSTNIRKIKFWFYAISQNTTKSYLCMNDLDKHSAYLSVTIQNKYHIQEQLLNNAANRCVLKRYLHLRTWDRHSLASQLFNVALNQRNMADPLFISALNQRSMEKRLYVTGLSEYGLESRLIFTLLIRSSVKNRLMDIALQEYNLKKQSLLPIFNINDQKKGVPVNWLNRNRIQKRYILFFETTSHRSVDTRNICNDQKQFCFSIRNNHMTKEKFTPSLFQTFLKRFAAGKRTLRYTAAALEVLFGKEPRRLFRIDSQQVSSAALEVIHSQKRSQFVTKKKYSRTWVNFLSDKANNVYIVENKICINRFVQVSRFGFKTKNKEIPKKQYNSLIMDKQVQSTYFYETDKQESVLRYLLHTKTLQKQIEDILVSKSRVIVKDAKELLQSNIEEEMQKYVQQEFRPLEEKVRILEKLIDEIQKMKAELAKQTEQKKDRERMRKLEDFFNNDMELERKRYGIQ